MRATDDRISRTRPLGLWRRSLQVCSPGRRDLSFCQAGAGVVERGRRHRRMGLRLGIEPDVRHGAGAPASFERPGGVCRPAAARWQGSRALRAPGKGAGPAAGRLPRAVQRSGRVRADAFPARLRDLVDGHGGGTGVRPPLRRLGAPIPNRHGPISGRAFFRPDPRLAMHGRSGHPSDLDHGPGHISRRAEALLRRGWPNYVIATACTFGSTRAGGSTGCWTT